MTNKLFNTNEAAKNGIQATSLIAPKNVLTVEEAALLIGLSKWRLYYFTCKKLIPYYKRGKRCYFRRSELEAWMTENRVATAQELEQQAAAYVVTGKKGKGAL